MDAYGPVSIGVRFLGDTAYCAHPGNTRRRGGGTVYDDGVCFIIMECSAMDAGAADRSRAFLARIMGPGPAGLIRAGWHTDCFIKL